MNVEPVARADIDPLLPFVQADEMGIDPDIGQWLAARDGGEIVGVARVTEIDGVRTIDDIWVTPERRRLGIAASLIEHAGRPVWLICDEDMISFYERRGFSLKPPEDFPPALAALYGARDEWPAATHTHHAMLLE
jgi:GNAT superfamily N-acetyltransferase